MPPVSPIHTTTLTCFDDDGKGEFSFIEQGFSDGSSVLMRKDQYDAIALAAARAANEVFGALGQ